MAQHTKFISFRSEDYFSKNRRRPHGKLSKVKIKLILTKINKQQITIRIRVMIIDYAGLEFSRQLRVTYLVRKEQNYLTIKVFCYILPNVCHVSPG